MFDVNQSLIRHWEKYFNVLKPKRNKKGNRLFTPQDVEQLKLIYHLVKERGMTLDGARRALRANRADRGVPRDLELLERLQRIRSLLVEVREELKMDAGEIYAARDAESALAPDPAEAPVAEPAVDAAAAMPAAMPESASVEAVEAAVSPDAEVPAASAAEPEPEVADAPVAAAEAPAAPGPLPAAEVPEVSTEPEEVPAASDPAPEAPETPEAAAIAAAAVSEPAEPADAPVLVFTLNEAPNVEVLVPADQKPAHRPGRKSRRKKNDDSDHQELFAFYEQSLF